VSRAALTLAAVYTPTVTPRQLIEAAFLALITQGTYGKEGPGACQYRVPNPTLSIDSDDYDRGIAEGNACVVGQLIPDDDYTCEVEGDGPHELVEWFNERHSSESPEPADAQAKIALLVAAQKIHDCAAGYNTGLPMKVELLRACDPKANPGLEGSFDAEMCTMDDVALIRDVLEKLP
jgi:hypothetical protein